MTDDRERRVEKPWGYERIWSQTGTYVGKTLFIAAGKRLSLQKHLVKDESFLVLRGHLRLHLEDADGVVRISDLEAGEHRHIAVGRIHRYEAVDGDVELVEVSTTELDDVVRIEDDFGREGTSAP